MNAGTEAELLRAWEDGGAVRGIARAVALAGPDAAPDSAWDLPVGARNGLLLALRERWFGDTVACTADCPGCAEELDVEFELAELPPTGPVAPVHVADVDGTSVSFRPVTSRDVVAAAAGPDPRRDLLARCLLEPAVDPDRGVLDAVARRLGVADPGAELSVELSCPACGQVWSAAFDPAEQVWAELDSFARRALYDVHRLALAYGWREPDVLALSASRRRYYLELVDR